MAEALAFPIPGSVVEFLEDNQVQTGFVMDEASGKLRVLLPNRRETKLGANRVLPWIGPLYSPASTREEAVKILESHRARRQEKADAIDPAEVWQLAAGEIEQAPASWFAELFETEPNIDAMAAYGRALLRDKIHFRFTGPDFTVYDQETVAAREEENQKRQEREALAGNGAAFFRLLWDIAQKKRPAPANNDFSPFLPDTAIADRLEKMLRARMVNPDTQQDDVLWHLLIRGLPEDQLLPIQLLLAWGKLPCHYNFWLDRAGYDITDKWWLKEKPALEKIIADATQAGAAGEQPAEAFPFLSIDGDDTTDIDDAFHLEKLENGWLVRLAFANPALYWPFGSGLDKLVSQRGTSIYLPEGTYHMLPPSLGEDVFSLWANSPKATLRMDIELNEQGQVTSFQPRVASACIAANLRYRQVEAFLDGDGDLPLEESQKEMLRQAASLGDLLESNRVANGAVILVRPEVEILLRGEAEATIVELRRQPEFPQAHRIVSELMVLASSALADWAYQRGLPLIYRTQRTSLPPEYAGIWRDEADMTKIMKAMIPSILELEPGPHAALGVSRYAPLTSPLRRYGDLLNEGQVIHYLEHNEPRWNVEELERLLNAFSPQLAGAAQAQRFRPRYWKLLYFRQQGDKAWWPGVITEENDAFVFVSLPAYGLFVRGKRELFDERATPGMEVMVRLGKVNPLYNEIHILETMQG